MNSALLLALKDALSVFWWVGLNVERNFACLQEDLRGHLWHDNFQRTDVIFLLPPIFEMCSIMYTVFAASFTCQNKVHCSDNFWLYAPNDPFYAVAKCEILLVVWINMQIRIVCSTLFVITVWCRGPKMKITAWSFIKVKVSGRCSAAVWADLLMMTELWIFSLWMTHQWKSWSQWTLTWTTITFLPRVCLSRECVWLYL